MSAEPRAAPRIDLKRALRKSALLHFMYSAERFASFNSRDPVVRSTVRREVLQVYINRCIVGGFKLTAGLRPRARNRPA